MNAPLRIAALTAFAAVTACAGIGPDEALPTVTGRAIYPESAALPPNSVLWVQLLDVSRQDVRADLIAETMIPLEGKRPPIEFRLAYRHEAIKPSHTYSVRARISVGERLLWTTTESYPVVTRNSPDDISVRLVPARRN